MKRNVLQWLEEKQPYLALALFSIEEKDFDFPQMQIEHLSEIDVLFIEGLFRIFPSISSFLERGGRVIFVEENLEKIKAFLSLPDISIHPNMMIILPEEFEYRKICKSVVFKRHRFVGRLEKLRAFLEGAHLLFSEYLGLGNVVFQNVQKNLLHTGFFEEGRLLKNSCLSVPTVVCGSGPSLKKGMEQLKKVGQKALILASGSSIPDLIRHQVGIDAGVLIDPMPPLCPYVSLTTFPLFYQNRMCSHLFSLHKGRKIWMGRDGLWPMEDWLYDQVGLPRFYFETGWNAGCFALHIAYFLGCNPIMLVGMDGGEKRDLQQGIVWMESFIEKHPDRKYLWEIQLEEGRKPPIARHRPFKMSKTLLKKAFFQLNDTSIQEKIQSFLDNLKKGGCEKELLQQIGIVDSYLEGEPVYQYHVEFLWKWFQPFYVAKGSFWEETISKYLFAKSALAFQQGGDRTVEMQYYPSKKVYAKNRYRGKKRDGLCELFYESGAIKARVFFSKGLLQGSFRLYAENGVCLREGQYHEGKKEGMHIIRGEDGQKRLVACFEKDLPKGEYKRMSETGHLLETIFYYHTKEFDRRVYSEEGDLLSDGVCKGGQYVEKLYAKGVFLQERKGIWKGDRLVWV